MPRECGRNSSLSFVIVIAIVVLAVGFAARAQDPESLFLPAVVYNPGGYRSVSAVVADVNRDGKLDVVVTNCALGTNQVCGEPGNWGVLLGNGNGTFKAVVTHAAGGPGFPSAAVADVNRDGNPDILIAWGSIVTFERGAIDVMLGNGDGTFQAAVTYDAGGVWPRSIAVADLNNDGLLDLLVANSGSIAVSVLLGNGDGTFQAAVPYDSGGANPDSMAVADVNGDRFLDVVVANYYGPVTDTGSIGVLLGNGDGSFQTPVTYIPSARGPVSVAVSDVNHDDRPDVVVAGYYGPETYSIGSIGVLLGNGDGTFQPSVAYGSGGSPTSTAVADIDGDGNEDLVAGNGRSRNIGILLGNGDGTFRAAVTYDSGGYYVEFVSVADLSGDGRTDVLALSDSSVGVLLNNSRTVQTPTNTMLTSSLNPSVYGQAIDFTAHVTSSSGTPAGTVTLFADEIALVSGTLVDGNALTSVSYLPAGSNAITAAYQASPGFAASKSVPLTQVVHAATTSTNVTPSANTVGTNQSITYTAIVTSQHGGAATGLVLFISGSQILGTAPLSNNRATLTTSFATPGNYSISARYAGDANNVGSMSAVLSQKVIASTKTTLSSSLNPALPGQAIKFTAFVSATFGLPPNGETVTFKNGTNTLGTAVLSGGSVSFTTSSLPAGAYTITASYGGDSNFAASTSPGLRQVVNATNRSASLTTMVSSLNPSTYGQAVTFMAMVTSPRQNKPTGNVVFRASQNGANFTVGTAGLNANGVASLTKSNLNGSYSYWITAIYSGDAFNLSSTSAVVIQVVKQARSAATITSSANPSSPGQAVTFTARITSPTVTVTGPVTFTAGNTVLGTVQLSRGTATFTTSALPTGSITVKVTHPWNSNVAKSSASLVQTVQ